MDAKNKTLNGFICKFKELSIEDQGLIKKAIDVRRNSQAPYSKFFVGAAVRSSNDAIYVGCNVERCTYTQTTHAEQNAIDSMVAAQGPSKIKSIAVVAFPADKKIILETNVAIDSTKKLQTQRASPCGHCLQIIWENCFGETSVKIMMLLDEGFIFVSTIGQLLPVPFGPPLTENN